MLDILFVRPNAKNKNYGVLDDFHLTAIEPPLWPAMLAAYCRSNGKSVDIIDAEAEGFNPDVLAYNIKELNPKIVVITVCGHNPSASTQSMVGVKELIALFPMNRQFKVVLHGLHPSALPMESKIETGADYVIIGEGFDIIPLFVEPPLQTNGGLVLSKMLIDLATLPQPAWDLLPIHRYRTHNWHCFGRMDKRQGYGVVYTSLGCPNNCSFCVIHVMTNNQRKVRFRPLELVLQDLDFWVSNGVDNIRFIDENFTINNKHTISICRAIKERYEDSLNIWAYASPTTITSKLLDAMRGAGIKWVGIGFESADLTEKGKNWEETVNIASMELKMADININANWIFGLPEDNWFTMQRTLHLAQMVNSEWANFYSAMAYPGSALYTEALKNGWALPDNWGGYSQYSKDTLPLPTKYLQAKEVLGFRDYAFNAYYGNPLYQTLIAKKFVEETKKAIEYMLTINLR